MIVVNKLLRNFETLKSRIFLFFFVAKKTKIIFKYLKIKNLTRDDII